MTAPKNFDDLYPGRFVKAGNLGTGKHTVTIADVRHEDLEGERGAEQKVIVSFRESKRDLVLCKLNATAIAAMFGKSIPDWIGKRIVLYSTNELMPMPVTRAERQAGKSQPDACIRIHGSPDLAADMPVQFKPARRRPLTMTMHATGKAPAEDMNP